MTHSRSRRLRRGLAIAMLATTCLLAATLLPTMAIAHPAPPASPSASAPTINVEVWPDSDQGRTIMIAVAEIPASAKLPAKVRIPLPAGAQITWSGQIMDGDGSTDIVEQPRTATGVGGRYVELTASKSRTVQYEAIVGETTVKGDARAATFAWTQTTDASGVQFAVRLPVAATNVAIKPTPEGSPVRNEELAQVLYGLPAVSLKPGATYALSVSYDVAAGSGANTGNGSGASAAPGSVTTRTAGTPAWVFPVVLVVVALVPVVVLVMRSRSISSPASEDGDTGEDEEADEVSDEEDGDSSSDDDDASR